MARAPRTDFQPKRLQRVDLEAPMAAGFKRLPQTARDELHGRQRDLVERTDPWGKANLQRIGRYALTGAVCVPLLANVFWHFHATSLLWMVPLAALYGALVAVLQPGTTLGGVLLWLFGIVFLVLDGQSPFWTGLGFVWFYHLAFIVIGTAVAASESLKER